jgi:hypothetical protein
MNDCKTMTRCDALQRAAIALLEQFRPMLDSTGTQIKAVTLELRIRPDTGQVHTSALAPLFETHHVQKGLEKFDFGS